MISKVSFLKLKKGDILFKIKMKDIWEEKDILNINQLLEINDINKVYKKNKKIEVIIDNKGLINIYMLDKKNNIIGEHKWTLNRKVSIEEFLDSIPNNIRLDLSIINPPFLAFNGSKIAGLFLIGIQSSPRGVVLWKTCNCE